MKIIFAHLQNFVSRYLFQENLFSKLSAPNVFTLIVYK